ncbi:MAG: hypothetical protein WAV52_02135, partial [Luteococcus japonicus]
MIIDTKDGAPGALMPGARRAPRLAMAAVTVLALGLGGTPAAHADDLTDKRDRINAQLADTRANVDEFSSELNKAASQLQASEAKLSQARTALAAAQQQRTA